MLVSGCYSSSYSVPALRAGSISLPKFLTNRNQHLLLCLDKQDLSGFFFLSFFFVFLSEVLTKPVSNEVTEDALSDLPQHNASLRNICPVASDTNIRAEAGLRLSFSCWVTCEGLSEPLAAILSVKVDQFADSGKNNTIVLSNILSRQAGDLCVRSPRPSEKLIITNDQRILTFFFLDH